jgi:antitoxin (DNA-binding transcriptional repressor) of toxin-antitoxin stability system
MTVVTLAEAQAQLADLLRRAATGEQIAIEHDGARLALSVARLPTPEEEAENQRRAEVEAVEQQRRRDAFIRELLGVREDAPLGVTDMPMEEYLKRYGKAA